MLGAVDCCVHDVDHVLDARIPMTSSPCQVVVRIDIDKDVQGWPFSKRQFDKHGVVIESRVYNLINMDRTLVLEERTELVARTITKEPK